MPDEIDQQHSQAEGLALLIPKLLELFPTNLTCCSVLDVGCGPGIIACTIKSRFGVEVIGVDCDSAFLEHVRAKGLPAYSCNFELDPLPFSDAAFDYVICIEVIEHLAKPENCLKEIARVLKPKGILIMSTPNLVGFENRLKIMNGKDPLSGDALDRSPMYHMRLYASNSLTQLLSPWFKITKTVYINQYPRRTWKGRGLDLLCLLKKDLASTLIVTCQLNS